MSGSPVYIDGRLLGAVAYRLVNFGHEAVAGIVSIEDMLQVSALESGGPGTSVAVDVSPELVLQAAADLLTGAGSAEALLPLHGAMQGVRPISTPIAIGGLAPTLVGRLAPLFDVLGWTPTLGGTAGSMEIEAKSRARRHGCRSTRPRGHQHHRFRDGYLSRWRSAPRFWTTRSCTGATSIFRWSRRRS